MLERKCPDCGSTDVKVLTLPLNEEEEFIYCNTCKKVNVVTKVKIK
jgi:transcription elongation factor Elf1